jgi:uncharacterized protein
MPSLEEVALSADDIDDILYLTRVDERDELQQFISDLAQKNKCSPQDVLLQATDPNSGNTVLHYASANNLLDLLKWFLAQFDDERRPNFINKPNGQGNTSLHWAAYNGHLEVVKTLITAGADMWIKNSAGHLALFEAERAERNDVAQFLLETAGARVERGGIESQPTADDVRDVEAEVDQAESGSSATPQSNGAAT